MIRLINHSKKFLRLPSLSSSFSTLNTSTTAPVTNTLVKPKEPEPEECCGNDCRDCVWIDYWKKLELYDEQMRNSKTPTNSSILSNNNVIINNDSSVLTENKAADNDSAAVNKGVSVNNNTNS